MYFLKRHFFLATVCIFWLSISSTDIKPRRKLGCRGKVLDPNTSSIGVRADKMIKHNLKKLKIPKRFDAREKWKKCKSLKTIYDQGDCGGCWAFSTAGVMSDRMCIATKGKFNKNLSTQDLLECCKRCVEIGEAAIGGCEGGFVGEAFEYWENTGLVTGNSACKPIFKGIIKGKPQKKCRKKCTNKHYKTDYTKDKTFGGGSLRLVFPQTKNLAQIQAEIMLNGPVVATFDIYEYLADAPEGTVLKYDKKQIKSGEEPDIHAIKLIGWDVIDGVPVWIMANSWGKDWCNGGFCYIRRGKNDFKIEEYDIVAGVPPTKGKTSGKRDGATSNGNKVVVGRNVIQVVVISCILRMVL